MSTEAYEATIEHVVYCFDVLNGHFANVHVPAPFPSAKHPLFVTWKKTSYGEYNLRGCIGTLQPKKLPEALSEYALISALKDRRFPPMKSDEIPKLQCTVSFLHSFQTAGSWDDWRVGTHGIIADFQDRSSGSHYNATYLPEVAEQENWSQEYTLKTLIKKAGYRGSLDSVLSSLKVTKYQSSACTLSYQEYQTFKQKRSTSNGVEHAQPVLVPA